MEGFLNAKPLPQVFPYNMMLYISKDPPKTAETQWKLIKICKFFYAKHSVLPISGVSNHNDDDFNEIVNMKMYEFANDKKKSIDIPLQTQEYKLWVTGEIFIGHSVEENETQHHIPFLFPHVYKWDITQIDITCFYLTHVELKTLLSSKFLTEVELGGVNIRYANGKEVKVDEIFSLMPKNIKEIRL